MIELQETEYCKVNVKYEIGSDEIEPKKTAVVNKYKNQKIPGFRQGKADALSIRLHFRKEIESSLTQELAQDAVKKAIFENNIKPFGQPSFKEITLNEDKFSCEFSLYKQPEFELGAYKEFEIPKQNANVSVEDLAQKMVQDLRLKNGKTTAFGENDEVQMGDTIILDYKTSMNGEVVESLTSNGGLLNVGKIIIPGFSENLLGMKLNDQKDFELHMPENFEKAEFADKVLNFSVKLLMGSKLEPAALDDTLANALQFETFDKLMEAVNSAATTRVREIEKNLMADQVSRRLVDGHEFKIPSWISTAEAKVNAKNNGFEWDGISEEDKVKCITGAEDSIKLSLILQKVREVEPLAQMTDEETLKVAKENFSKVSEKPDDVMREIFQNGHLPILLNRIRDENTIDFIEKTCKIVE